MKPTLPAILVLFLIAAAVAAQNPSDRTVEILRYGCANSLGRREVTLFGNGTVRLRDGERGKEAMGLDELGPDEYQGAIRRLEGEELSEVRPPGRGIDGEWIERGELILGIPGRPVQVFHFGRYDSLPLQLSRVVRIAEDLAAGVQDLQGVEQLPPGYEPKPGDVLKRVDSQLYEVVAFTADNRGVELRGVDQPLTLFILREELRREFVLLLPKRP